MLINNLNITPGDNEEKLQRCQEYVDALEEERRKIQVFERELPLCLELVTRAIEACKHQITSGATEYHFVGQSECSEQTSSEGPILEEFIPIKRASHSSDEEKLSKRIKNNCTEIDSNINDSKINDNKESKKSDWLRSVQLWNQSPDPTPKEDTPKKVQVVEVKRDGSGGAFHPFKREKSVGTSSTSTKEKSGNGVGGGKVAATSDKVAAASPRVDTGGNNGGSGGGECNKKEEKEGEGQRKQRRCWSAELHKRFLQALQQLGGSHVATPKQIRELMKVDLLTNDEVKSHLQKYRLHTRRPTPSMHNNNTQQAPQFVVVGGIWVPPPEYSAMAHAPSPTGEASTVDTPNGVYAPIASHPSNASMPSKQRHQQKNLPSVDHGNHSEGRCASHSPATSSSDTTTASPSAC